WWSGHYPFGESWYEATPASKWKFTSYERDGESQLDYAIFRGYNSRLGRFMQADLLAGSTGDPQSLNRYSYTRNDPEDFIDPLGLSYEWIGNCLYEVRIPEVIIGKKKETDPPVYYLVGCVWSPPAGSWGGWGGSIARALRAVA